MSADTVGVTYAYANIDIPSEVWHILTKKALNGSNGDKEQIIV